MMQRTIGARIASGYVFAVVFLVVLGGSSYWSIDKFDHAAFWSDHTYQVLTKLRLLQSNLENAETGQRGYLLVGETRYLEPYRQGISQVAENLKDIRKLTSDNPDQQKRLDALEPLIAGKFAELEKTIDLRRSKGFDAALAVVRTDKGKDLMDDIRRLIGEMQNEEKTLLNLRNTDADESSHVAIAIIAIGVPLVIGLLVAIGAITVRVITRQLNEGIGQLASSASEILATTTQVASGAAETATAVSETTATVEEVKQTALVASQKAKYVADSAQKVSQVTQAGRKSVEDSIAGMYQIQEQMESIAGSIVRLAEQGQAIGEIIASVNDLAEQSNVLAVNAAIEATKAGEQGKGFAVVAQEIKILSEQSKQATGQVRSILGDIQKATSAAVLATEQGHKAVDAGVRQSTEAGDTIRQLAESINETAQAATQIAASSQQQMVGMDQVMLAMENIKQASSQNVAGTKQAEIAAKGLHELGLKLSTLIRATAS